MKPTLSSPLAAANSWRAQCAAPATANETMPEGAPGTSESAENESTFGPDCTLCLREPSFDAKKISISFDVSCRPWSIQILSGAAAMAVIGGGPPDECSLVSRYHRHELR